MTTAGDSERGGLSWFTSYINVERGAASSRQHATAVSRWLHLQCCTGPDSEGERPGFGTTLVTVPWMTSRIGNEFGIWRLACWVWSQLLVLWGCPGRGG